MQKINKNSVAQFYRFAVVKEFAIKKLLSKILGTDIDVN